MTSRKRQARAKQVAEFKASLGGLDSVFECEDARRAQRSADREAALRNKACESKNRYPSKGDAQEAIRLCAEHGTTGLHCYRCQYCNGWHLTSKPERDA